jgi:hypothetical protein
MTEFEKWEQALNAAEAAALGAPATNEKGPAPLCEIDQAVHDLCQNYSEADLLAAAAAAPEPPETSAAQSRSRVHSFKASTDMSDDPVEEAYQQLLGIAAELLEEITARRWRHAKDFVDTHIEHIRAAHDRGKVKRLASSIARGLERFKAGLEMMARYAPKKQSQVADVGELILLTALSAHEFRRALCVAYKVPCKS